MLTGQYFRSIGLPGLLVTGLFANFATGSEYTCRIVDFGHDVGGDHYRGMSGGGTITGITGDFDGDGRADDSIAYWGFSMTNPLTPPAIHYDRETPSAMYYGGIVGYFMDTDRGMFTEGMPNENHALRDDHNMMANPSGDADPSRAAGIWIWKKEDFLNGGDDYPVTFDTNSLIGVHISRYFNGVDSGRWFAMDGTNMFLSEKTFDEYLAENGLSNYTYVSYMLDPTDTRWAPYEPQEPYPIQFDSEAAVFSHHTFTNVTAVGWYVYKDEITASGIQVKWHSFETYATVHRPETNSFHMDMAEVPAGTYRNNGTGAVYSVSNFHIARTEIPYTLWKKIRKWAGSNQYLEDLKPGYGFDTDGDMGSMDLGAHTHAADEPATDFTWYDAIAWCNAMSEYEGKTPCYYADPGKTEVLRIIKKREYPSDYTNTFDVYVDWSADGYRLPTPAEWVYAAEAGAGSLNAGTSHAWTRLNASNRTHAVGSPASNAFGLYDTLGHVWEYVWDVEGDHFDPDVQQHHRVMGGGLHYPNDPGTNSPLPFAYVPYDGSYNIGMRPVRYDDPVTPITGPLTGSAPVWTVVKGQAVEPAVPGTPVTPSNEMVYISGTNVYNAGEADEETDNTAFLRYGDEAWVTVSPFYMSANEITYAQWKDIYQWGQANGYEFDMDGDMGSMDWQTGQHTHQPSEPVTDMTWYDLVLWCNALSEYEGRDPCYYSDSNRTVVIRNANQWRIRMEQRPGFNYNTSQQYQDIYVRWEHDGYRLPTEAEWEVAYRDGDTRYNLEYPWSGGTTSAYLYSWFAGNSGGTTHPVGQKQPNGYGLYDLGGNVTEWTWDWPHYDYYRSHNPKGRDGWMVPFGKELRGGNFGSEPVFATRRHEDNERESGSRCFYGFRVVRCEANEHPEHESFDPPTVLTVDPGDYDRLDGQTYRYNLWRSGYYPTPNDGASGATNWIFETGGPVQSSPVVCDGVMYIGSDDGCVYALDASTGSNIWTYQTGGPVKSSATIVDGVVYIGSDDYHLYAIYAEDIPGSNICAGDLKWKFKHEKHTVEGSPAVAYGVVFVGWGHNRSECLGLDADTGEEVWRYRLNTVNNGPGSITVYGTNLYFNIQDARFIAANISNEQPVWDKLGHHSRAGIPILNDGSMVFYWANYEMKGLDRETGDTKWATYIGSGIDGLPYSSPAVGPVDSGPGLTNMLYAGHEKSNTVYAFNPYNGDILWEYNTGARVFSSPALTDDEVYIGSDNGKLYAFDVWTNPADQVNWSWQLGDKVYSSPWVDTNGTVYVGSDDGKIYAIADRGERMIFSDVDALSVAEGGTAMLQVRLNTKPASAVTVSVARTAGDADLSVDSGATLVFDAANWDVYQAVQLSAAEDADAANGTATLTCSAEGARPAVVEVSEADDELSIMLSTTDLTVDEGTTSNLQVRLNVDPSVAVTVTANRVSGDADIGLSGGGPFVFTPATWSAWQDAPVYASDDADQQDGSAVIRFSAPGLSDRDVHVSEEDDDDLEIIASTDSISVPEGSNAVFDVRLSVMPASAVTVTVARTSGDGDITVASGGSLLFTTANWDSPQPVQLSGGQDGDRSNGTAVITCSAPAVGSDVSLTATEYDDDVVRLETDVTAVSVPEGGADSFRVRLSTLPDAAVTVRVTKVSGDGSLSVAGGGELVFTPGNWGVYQSVTVAAAENDGDYEDGTATLRCSSDDADGDIDVSVTELDNDITGIHFQDGVAPTPAYAGTDDTYLDSDSPTTIRGALDRVLVRANNHRHTLLRWDLSAISTPSTRVHTASITLDVYNTGGSLFLYRCRRDWSEANATWNDYDASHAWQAPGATGAMDAASTLLGTGSGASAAPVTIELNAAGVAAVRDWVRAPSTNDGFLLVSETDDAIWIRSSEYAAPAQRPRLSVGYSFDARPEIEFSSSAVEVPEGSNATVQVKLTTSPAGAATVSVQRVSGDADISVTGGGERVFSPADWDLWQPVTLSASEDADESNGTAVIRASAPGMTARDVTATEVDNDAVGVFFSPEILAVEEGAITGLTFRLDRPPASSVTVTVSRVSGDADVHLAHGAPEIHLFDATDWDTWRTVFVSAREDVDTTEGTTRFGFESPNVHGGTVTVSEVENDSAATTVLFDFGPTPSTGHWNNITATGIGTPVADAVDRDGLQTGIALDITNAFHDGLDGIDTNALYPASAQGDFLRVNALDAQADFVLRNLDPAALVDVVLFGSQANQSFGSLSEYRIEGASETLETYLNTTNTVLLSGVAPRGDGTIHGTLTEGGSGVGVLNVLELRVPGRIGAAVDIEASTNALALPEGGTDSIQIRLSAEPDAATTVSVARAAGDADISVDGAASFVFSTANWSTWQPVAVTAAADGDALDGTAYLRCGAEGATDLDIRVTEIDAEAGDADADGLPDAWELRYSGGATNMDAYADDDGDGFLNLHEYIAMTDPTNAAAMFVVNHVAAGEGGHYTINWNSASGRVYGISRSARAAGGYSAISSGIAAHPPVNTWTDTVHSSSEAGFYRIEVQMQP